MFTKKQLQISKYLCCLYRALLLIQNSKAAHKQHNQAAFSFLATLSSYQIARDNRSSNIIL